mmetsp:Transcript_26876/g.64111  ORF Transcript_26876/g.64111 Transcript_26876/m.64111 type:complete len:300 (+) Transcript_26876:314-1213(+)
MIGKRSRQYTNKHLTFSVAAVVIILVVFLGIMSPPSFSSALTPVDDIGAKQNRQPPGNGGSRKFLRLAVFDLDYTIWQPEMYQLYGKPRLVAASGSSSGGSGSGRKGRRANAKVKTAGSFISETRTMQDGMMITDGSGSPMRVFPGAAYALTEIHEMKSNGYDIQAAIASKTDEPSWAHFCMKHLAIPSKRNSSNDGSSVSASEQRDGNNNHTLIPLKDCFMVGETKSKSLIEIAFENKQYHFQQLHRKTGIPFEEMVFFDNEYGNIRSVSKLGVHCVYTPDGMHHQHWDDAKREFGIE